jgi:hypothetical protein
MAATMEWISEDVRECVISKAVRCKRSRGMTQRSVESGQVRKSLLLVWNLVPKSGGEDLFTVENGYNEAINTGWQLTGCQS